jgi:drug/metabolite transporter (DMT)-like permease
VLSGAFFAASTISFVMSVRLTTAANTLVIIAAMPLFAAVLSKMFLGDRVEARTWLAVTAGLAGISIVFRGSLTAGQPLGDLLALATALLMASNFVIIRKYRHVNMIPAVLLSGVITTAVTAFLCHPLSVKTADVLLLAVMGAVVLPIPLSLMTIGPKLIPAAEVSLIMLLETFLGPFWVWLILGERPARETFMGGGVLVLTLVVHALVGMKEP